MKAFTTNTALPLTLVASSRSQLLRIWRPALIATAIIAVALAFIAALSNINGVAIDTLTRDTVAVVQAPNYTGMLSNLGLMGWAAAAGIWLLAIKLPTANPTSTQLRQVALWSGLLTLALLFDDTFMLHEDFFPNYLNISEKIVTASYGFSAIAYIAFLRPTLRKTDYLLGLIALGLLGASAVSDRLLPMSTFETLIEDGLKFSGIIFWLIYAHSIMLQLICTTQKPAEV
jgi:hypothetical protein